MRLGGDGHHFSDIENGGCSVHGSSTAGWLLVALCAGAGSYCLLRLRSRVDEQRRAAGSEALMGFGMAAMAIPAAMLTPPGWVWLLYAVVFGAGALRTLAPARRSPHHLHHLLGMLVMVYMAGAMAAVPGGTHGMHTSAGGVPLVTGALLVYYAGYVLWAGVRLLPRPAAAGPAGSAGPGTLPFAWSDRPELAMACRLSMGIAMLAMLLTL